MGSLRVLVAEDNEDHRYLTVRALRELGSQIVIDEVADGEAALEYLKGHAERSGAQPNLILLDLRMPRRNGLEVLAVIKSDPKLRKIPTVMLTSSDRREDVEAAYEAGANSYVTKPTTASGLREGLRRLGDYWGELVVLPGP